MARVLIDTYGCTLNRADSDIMEGLLKSSGFEVENGGHSTPASHDYVIVNTCTVKNPTETRIIQRLKDLSKTNSKIIVTGCMASANSDKVLKAAPNASIVTTSNIHRIADAINYMGSSGKPGRHDKYSIIDKLKYYPGSGSIISRVPVSEGCLSSCSFCETKFARGPLNSFSEKLILKAVEMSVSRGAKEIELTSQDMGAYGIDKGTNIAELVANACDIDGDFRIRVGMLNPEHLPKYFDQLVEAYSSSKVYKFIHLPVQSGSNMVLRHMNRNYTIEEFNGYVNELRKKIDGISIETDIIVGYPTETREDYAASIEFVRETRPTFTNVSRFGARPHARASKLRQLANSEIKSRSTEMSRTARQVQNEDFAKLIGRTERVLINEANDRSFLARDSCYRIIALDRNANRVDIGDVANARIKSNSSVCLFGELVG